jgi:CBS domain-containing protein
MRIEDLMSRPPVTCHFNDPLNLVAHEMWDHDCGVLLVVNDDGKLIGVITDRDICMAAYTQGRPLDAILANSAMATHVISIRPDEKIADAERLMAKHQIRRLPVVDDDNRPVGVIALNDLARECARSDTDMENLASVLAAICQPRASTQQAA